jgi:PAS domain S-box-containing protein
MVSTSVPVRRFLSHIDPPLPWIVLGLSVLTIVIAWRAINHTNLLHAETDLKLRAERSTTAIRERMFACEQILRGGVALFGINQSISRLQWREYVGRLRIGESFPGIQSIGFAKVVTAKEKDTHINAIRAEGFPEYDIRPGGTREIYASIIYREPFSGRDVDAFGYDMFSEPAHRAAMERARDSGATTVSSKVSLALETEDKPQAGFLMYSPVYRGSRVPSNATERRSAVLGYVYAPFRMRDLMAGVLDGGIADIDLEIFDGTAPASEALLFEHRATPRLSDGGKSVAISHTSTIDVNGQAWTLQFGALPNFMASRNNQQNFLVLVGGGVISLLLFGLTWTLSRRRDKAVSIADQMSASLAEKEQRFTAIFHSAMDAIITIDEQQNIVLFNPAAELVFRCTASEAIGTPLSHFMPERFRAVHAGHIDRFGSTGVSDRQMGNQRDLFGLRADGEEFPLEASISQTTEHGKRHYTVILRDITARKTAEIALRESELRFRGLVETNPEAIYVHQDEEIVFVNRAAQVLVAADAPGQLIGKSIYAFFHPDSRDTMREAMQAILGGAGSIPAMERKIIRLDGEVRFVEVSVSGIDNAGKRAVLGMMRDITERYQARAELEISHAELRLLSNALETAQEEERKRIARELHDDLGQTLTVLKMDMSSLKSKLADASADAATYAVLMDGVARMDSQLNQIVQSLRRISADLRPQMLDDLGLATALETLLKQVSRGSNIRCTFELNPERLSIDKRLATPLYRIAQESLNNVVKHASATEVKLSLYRDDSSRLILEVRDDGRGIAPEDRRKAASFGLIGMRERAYALGGELHIESEPGKGALVRITIPKIGNEAVSRD